VLYLDDGSNASVYLLRNLETKARRLYTDGILAIDTNYESLQTVKLLGHIPVLLCEKPKDVLVIGFGIGKTASSIALHPVERIDCVEIVPEVLEASVHFLDLNNNVLSDPRLNMVIDDGRSFLFGTDRRYDVISCDPIHPAFGSPALYTTEYYIECRKKLNEGGVIVQYLPFHQLSAVDLAVLLRTFTSVFPHTSIWMASYHCIIAGSNGGFSVDVKELERRLGQESVNRDLAESNIEGIDGFLSRMILGEDQVKRLVSGRVEMNTDNHPILEYAESRYFGRNTWTENVERVIGRMETCPYRRIFKSHLPDSLGGYALESLYQARRHAMTGRLSFEKENELQAIAEFIKQLEITPGDSETLYFAGPALEVYFLKRARDLASGGDRAEAIASLEHAVRIGIESADILAALSVLHQPVQSIQE
jgi:spermidine synthase